MKGIIEYVKKQRSELILLEQRFNTFIESTTDQMNKLESLVRIYTKEPFFEVFLPNNLKVTYIALKSLDGNATASMVSEKTKRQRAVESHYLSLMVVMGLLNKERIGRKVFYYIIKKEGVK